MKAATLILGSLAALALAAAPLAAQAAPDGKALYEKNCRSCHGARGAPPAALAKQLNVPKWDAAYIAARSDDSLVHVMKRGGKNMKGFDGKMSAQEMAAVAKYVRELMGAKPGS